MRVMKICVLSPRRIHYTGTFDKLVALDYCSVTNCRGELSLHHELTTFCESHLEDEPL